MRHRAKPVPAYKARRLARERMARKAANLAVAMASIQQIFDVARRMAARNEAGAI